MQLAHFHAFQATSRKEHEANATGIKDLQEKVGGGSNLSHYYIVPEGIFDIFVTKPVNPKMTRKRTLALGCWTRTLHAIFGMC
jgi:hypothetical protein